jgi:hypothetical protein
LWKKKIKIHPQKYFKYPWGDCIIFCCEPGSGNHCFTLG